jgi:hypothetical protein
MSNELQMTEASYRDIARHLLQDSVEQVAFVFARPAPTPTGIIFEAGDYYLVPPEDFAFQSAFHVSLTDGALARIIKMAWDRREALVEIHSHTNPEYAAAFSPSDLVGLEEIVPHVWWRLKGQPYLAMVIGPTGFDALVWRLDPHTPEALTLLRIGRRSRQPTGITLARLRRQNG